jgi:hypothetical protein
MGEMKVPNVYIDKKGYKRFKASGKRVDRTVMERRLGTRLSKDVIVHHINGIKTDSRFENLQLMTKKEYSKTHMARKDNVKTSTLVEITKISTWLFSLIIKRIIDSITNVFRRNKS